MTTLPLVLKIIIKTNNNDANIAINQLVMFLKFAEVKAVCHRSMLKEKKKKKVRKETKFNLETSISIIIIKKTFPNKKQKTYISY